MRRSARSVEVAIGVLFIVILSHHFATLAATAFTGQNASSEPTIAFNRIRIDLVSSSQINGIAGQFVSIKASMINLSANETLRGVAYISIVDLNNSLPIDLEDWSAQKGFYLPSILPGQSVSVEWNLRLVKAGFYTVTVIFSEEGDLYPPTTSPRVLLQVAPKMNLNPSNVLPVAFGIPALLIVTFAVINYRRGKKMGVYS